VSFDFAGHDRVWTDSWSDQTVLPSAVRITLRNANSDQILAISTATLVHITAPGACALQAATSQCLENKEKSAPEPAPGADQSAPKGVL
jgi:general secretion pathway protein J